MNENLNGLSGGRYVELEGDTIFLTTPDAPHPVAVPLPRDVVGSDVTHVDAWPIAIRTKSGDLFTHDGSSWRRHANTKARAPAPPPPRGPRALEATATDLREQVEYTDGKWRPVLVTGGSRTIGGPEPVQNGDTVLLPPRRAQEWLRKGWAVPADAGAAR